MHSHFLGHSLLISKSRDAFHWASFLSEKEIQFLKGLACRKCLKCQFPFPQCHLLSNYVQTILYFHKACDHIICSNTEHSYLCSLHGYLDSFVSSALNVVWTVSINTGGCIYWLQDAFYGEKGLQKLTFHLPFSFPECHFFTKLILIHYKQS